MSPRSKRRLARAASYADKTITDFVLDSALRSADEVVRAHEVITLTPAEWRRLTEALLDPPAPNKALKKAFREHRRLTGA